MGSRPAGRQQPPCLDFSSHLVRRRQHRLSSRSISAWPVACSRARVARAICKVIHCRVDSGQKGANKTNVRCRRPAKADWAVRLQGQGAGRNVPRFVGSAAGAAVWLTIKLNSWFASSETRNYLAAAAAYRRPWKNGGSQWQSGSDLSWIIVVAVVLFC